MKVALMVAEKPSLALSIAKILSRGQARSRKGSNGACSVHEYIGQFRGQNIKFKMTSVCGHVMTMDFPGTYNNWDKVDPAELFSCDTIKKESTAKLRMVDYLKQEGNGCDYLILWLDCDKEGENICFEVIDAVKPVMNLQNRDKTIYRAKFSAVTEKDLNTAMGNLVDPNYNESLSVDARMELDLRIGCVFTRYQTKFFQGKYGNLDSSLISFGPCQTPTLGFCVNRHDKIQSFKPEPYWVIDAKVKHHDGALIDLDWDRGRIFDKECAEMFLNIVKDGGKGKVKSVQMKEKVKQRPQALNTVELMKVSSSGLGMSPHHAMQLAEKLYTQGYISYPRTETTQYPENFDLRETLRLQKRSPEWGADVSALIVAGVNKPRKGKDLGDHPPITPMKSATQNDVTGDMWKIYDYITRHFIATLADDCHYQETVTTLDVSGEIFSCSGKRVTVQGFIVFMPWLAVPEDESMPDFNTGQICAISTVKLTEKLTRPPDYLTESELITLMEKHGIGTDASIPVHINNISERNYVTVGSGRKLIPTTLGIVLVHGYQKIDHELVLPTMRAAMEKQLNLISEGKADFNAVVDHGVEIYKRKFEYFTEHIQSMDELFEVSFTPLSESGKPMSRCGKCHRYMKYVMSRPHRLHCKTCDETYSLPPNGNIKIYRELKCPLDEFEIIQFCSPKKSYTICPYCYTNPPFPDMRKGNGCNQCTHPSCLYGMMHNGIAQCGECEFGVLVLDPTSAQKWRIDCNKCDVAIHLFHGAQKLLVLPEIKCEQCGANTLDIEYKEGSPLEDRSTSHSGCIFCDPLLRTHIKYSKTTNIRISGPPRGQGRGGRVGGRSRGRSRGQ